MNFDQRRLTIWAICIGLPVMFLLLPPTQPAMFATMGIFSHMVLWIFDCAAGAEAFGVPPVAMWALIGAIIGGCLGFWKIAPAIGKRSYRRIASAIPITLLITLLIGNVLFSITRAPAAVPLIPPNVPGLANQNTSASQQPPATTANDPNNVKAPSLYTPPTEDELSTAPEGGGGSPEDKTVNMSQNPNLPSTPPPTGSSSTSGGTQTQPSNKGQSLADRIRRAVLGHN